MHSAPNYIIKMTVSLPTFATVLQLIVRHNILHILKSLGFTSRAGKLTVAVCVHHEGMLTFVGFLQAFAGHAQGAMLTQCKTFVQLNAQVDLQASVCKPTVMLSG